MAAEPKHSEAGLLNNAMEHGLNLYRRTFKRLRPVHAGLHWLVGRVVIPLLERLRRFRTIPDDPLWFRLELLTQNHENETRKQIEACLRPGMVVLDVGAHIGYYARICARLVGSNGRVVAFEPHPRTFGVLQANTARFAGIDALQIAAAEQEGSAQLHDYLMMSASGSLHYDASLHELQRAQLSEFDIAPRMNSGFSRQTYDVRTAPIDACLAELGIERVDLVKMDIEGAEIDALRGMRQTISNSPGLTLIMEYNPQALHSFGHDPAAALDEVLRMGFSQMFMIRSDGSLTELTGEAAKIGRLTENLMSNMGVVNVLFRRNAAELSA